MLREHRITSRTTSALEIELTFYPATDEEISFFEFCLVSRAPAIIEGFDPFMVKDINIVNQEQPVYAYTYGSATGAPTYVPYTARSTRMMTVTGVMM